MRRISPLAAIALTLALGACQAMGEMRDALSASVESLNSNIFGSSSPPDVAHASPRSPVDKPQAVSEGTVISGPIAAEAVIDGDTIAVNGIRIRLFGMDAPELSQTCLIQETSVPCGVVARNALIGFVAGATIQCERTDVDRFGRDVSRCYADGKDLSAAMVLAGLAIAYRQFSLLYVSEEEEAKLNKRGMWKGAFTMPWDWRAQRRQ